MTFKENVVMRLIGLFILLAPNHGAEFLGRMVLGVNERLAEDQRRKFDKAMAA